MTSLAHDRYCDEIAHQVREFRAVVTSGADLNATVPTCPDWSLEDLVRHMGRALRWVDLLVRTRAQENVPGEQAPGHAGPEARGDAAALDAWLAESGAAVVDALREAGPDTKVWAWAGKHDAGFWARRMTHEITVHRADAALAAGLPYRVAADVAADAIEEWLEIVRFVQQVMPDGPARELRRPGHSIHLHATDTAPGLDGEWLIELPEEGVTWRRGHEKATVALRGPLTSVLLAFYRRLPLDAPELEVLGERELLDFWLERATFG
ncbi:maleylpyruvate isomerase family mycothiol-dependent enzyme [Streptomyces sp. TRM S81-3]|uniref:Maleylpyruvate isomerase family mycothiol-dependent enzyme n=1 Tax=Streptomyces griseicoloratus TaxID=2752516 RepID=A0A926LCK3_9ACTN|nr:maleylpyruvate isomerase family mycothiol-dependent enzyme [Streptomyces griseicoloratus]MBD0424152.1 maleylpyruvate isomerase family mycothiol-dependent enzyme [Streptomyces griseicoloratus]